MAEVFIVLIIFGAIFGRGLLRSYYSHREKMRAIELHKSNTDVERENSELLEKVNKLSERVEVLERIITDEKYQLDRKIANL